MERDRFRLVRQVPEPLAGLAELALDTRWTWNHQADALWARIDAESWRMTQNAWFVLQSTPSGRLAALARDKSLVDEVARQVALRRAALERLTWFEENDAAPELACAAYLSMEFGLSEALPLYSGGLGVLAGDFLKAASDLGVPVVGIGLLYQTGYFRQVIDEHGEQRAVFPYNNPMMLPILPTLGAGGEWKTVSLALPGRTLRLRCWEACVGRVTLYLLDSNDPLNAPRDRGITGELYADQPELRFLQEMVLGIGGYRLLDVLGIDCNVLHLNEGHAALAVLERARAFMRKRGVSFDVALACTRAGTLFTTHTPVVDAFDRFESGLVARYLCDYAAELGLEIEPLLDLGRERPRERAQPFTMPLLALRGAGHVNGVSRLHGAVSREIFQPLFPRWPSEEVPIGHVTNGVHVPSWDSAMADRVWERACGKSRWLGEVEALERDLATVTDQTLWEMRNAARCRLVEIVRERAARQHAYQGASRAVEAACASLLDPDVLTLGFARRFARYKRPNLLLHDRARLSALLRSASRPVQLIVAGKAHPNDPYGAGLLREWSDFLRTDPAIRGSVVFLEDYDLGLAQPLVQGVDVWVNTPRPPWEACGTSGMKILVNGGIHLSVLDGWWAEHYDATVGFAIGKRAGPEDVAAREDLDARDAESLYSLLEREVVPEFYERDGLGIPRRWLSRVRASMAKLTPRCSANRMMQEYVTSHYGPLARGFHARSARDCELGAALVRFHAHLDAHWSAVRFGQLAVATEGETHRFEVHLYADNLDPDELSVELYAEPTHEGSSCVWPMERGIRLSGTAHAYVYEAKVPSDRPASDYTPRVVPCFRGARLTLELAHITWQR